MKLDLQKITNETIITLRAKLVNLNTLTAGKSIKETKNICFRFFCENFTCEHEKLAIDSLVLFCLGEKSNFNKFF
jgi:hypothetical protein